MLHNKLLLIVLAVFLAPVAVFLKKGAGKDLLVNVILCFMLYLPAVLHALWLVAK